LPLLYTTQQTVHYLTNNTTVVGRDRTPTIWHWLSISSRWSHPRRL